MFYKKENLVFYWLILCTLSVLTMVAIGGATRLTNSGLSMTEWKPITGILPPLSEYQWQEEFAKYQASPEFIHINNKMDINGFKKIFWLEYIHRVAGRIIGMIFFIPLIYFLYKNYLSPRNKKVIFLTAIIGICQGFMGWYMVKSGLKDSPHVSHFRLSFHLFFALVIFLLLLNESLSIYFRKQRKTNFNNLFILSFVFLVLQIILGAFVAGLDAGLIYNQFPLMGEKIWPNEIFEINISQYLYNDSVVQFLHRINAYILVAVIGYLILDLIKKEKVTDAIIILGITFLQFILGIITLIYSVPLASALMHQVFAFILASALLISYWSSAK